MYRLLLSYSEKRKNMIDITKKIFAVYTVALIDNFVSWVCKKVLLFFVIEYRMTRQ